MITNGLLDLAKAFIDGVIATRPDWQIHLPDGMGVIVARALALDSVVPMHECIACGTLYMTAFSSMTIWKWSVKLIDWIMAIIP